MDVPAVVLTLEDVAKITALVLIITQLTKMYVLGSKWAPLVALGFSMLGALLYAATYEVFGRHLIFPYAMAIGSIWMQSMGVYEIIDNGIRVARGQRDLGGDPPAVPETDIGRPGKTTRHLGEGKDRDRDIFSEDR